MNIYTWLKTRMCTPNNNSTCTWNSAHHGVMTTYNACNKCINWIHKLNRKISYLSSSFIRQESLANAKVSTWQPWYIGRKSQNQPDLGQPNVILYIIQKYTFSAQQVPRWQCRSIFIRLAVVASQTCQLAENSQKIWTYSSSRSSSTRLMILVPIESAYATSY